MEEKKEFSFISLWKARDELSFKNIRPAFWNAWLLFPLAIVLSDLRFLDQEMTMFGQESYILIMIAYSLGWLTCVFLPSKTLFITVRICTIVLIVTLVAQMILEPGQARLIMFLIFHLVVGVCVACGFYVYVFTLQNAERFFGMAFVILYYCMIDMLWQYDAVSGFLKGPGVVVVMIIYTAAVFLGKKENFPLRETHMEDYKKGCYIVFFIYIIFFIIDLTNMYIDYEAEFSLGFFAGIGGIIAVVLAFLLQMVFNKSVWHLWNIFLILSIAGGALFLIDGSMPEVTGSILYGTANSTGYFAVIYMMGGAGKRNGSLFFFKLACLVTFINNSVIALGFDALYWYVIYDYDIQYNVVVFAVVLVLACICISLIPLLDKRLFNTDWSDGFRQLNMPELAEHAAAVDKIDCIEKLGLTAREREIFILLLTEDSPKQIAGKLMISGATVNFHTNNLYRKLDIQSRTQLFAEYAHYVENASSQLSPDKT